MNESSLLRKKGSLSLALLGLWILMAPISFGYFGTTTSFNDVFSGFLVLLFSFLALKTKKKIFFAIPLLVGFWLQLAPLFFWTKEPVAYVNDTLAGMLLMIIVFSLPGMADHEDVEETPPGWSFNPSSWGPRSVTVFLAFVCWFLARYLASYQLGYIQEVRDPFFGDGSMKVISSSVAQLFPVSDAGLGAFAYSLEFLLGFIGGGRRWKSMPWLAICFGAMVVPAGMISILLIVLQPILVGAFCGICLMIAVCMLVMILLTLPEVIAVIQLLVRAKKRGKGFWSVFWKGDTSPVALPEKPLQRTWTSSLGFTIPWNLALTICLSVWVLVSPSVLNLSHPASDSNYIMGPLLFAFSVISFGETVRFLRFANLVLGIAFIVSVFLLKGFSELGWISNLTCGIFACLLSFPKGRQREKCG